MKIASREQPKNALGSLAWGEASKGVLNEEERGRVVEKFKFVMTQAGIDADRRRLGLLKPKHIPLTALAPPDSKIVKDALAYAEETHVEPLLRHSWRTYYFGALIAAHDEIGFDRELGFTASILHDLGLTASANPRPGDCCFAVGGALQARRFLMGKGYGRNQVDVIADAISLHLNIHVSAEEHGAIAFLVARGAVCDVFGVGVSRISSESIKDVIAKYSRAEVYTALHPPGVEHLDGTRRDAYFQAGLVGQGQVNPLDTAPFA